MDDEYETATFNTADLTEQGLDKIEKNDVVTFKNRTMIVRGREDNWSLELGMTTTLTFAPYKSFLDYDTSFPLPLSGCR